MSSVFEYLAPILSVWHLTRAAGLVAYGLLFTAVMTGILQSMRILPLPLRPALAAIHNAASWFGLMFALLHGCVLLFDDYVTYTAWEIAVPFLSDHESVKEAAGILSFYLFFLLILSSDLQKKIGRRAWRLIHYGAFLAYALALTHGVILGTDTNALWMQIVYSGTAAITACVLALRILLGIAR
jgi:predicted ferric reductase